MGDLARFAVDSMAPSVAVTPATVDQLRETLRAARDAGLAAIAVGGGRHLGAGNLPERYDVAVSTRALNRVIAHEPADMTVTVQPGLVVAALNERLAEHGQMLPLDPPCAADATIGGVLGANAYGPLRHAFGTARDWLIGTRVAHADGTSSRSGGRVVKNVTGYDMHKLYVGSLGTLGVITEATFKLAPLPKARRTAVVACESAASACGLVLSAHEAGLALHAAEVLSPGAAAAIIGRDAWLVLARVAGGPAAVERSIREMRAISAGDEVDVREDAAPWPAWAEAFAPDALSLRAAVLPTQVAATLDEIARAAPAPRLSATVSAGVVRLRFDGGDAALIGALRAVIARHGGALVVEAAPAEVKRTLDVFGPARPDLAIARRLKEQFDPSGVLSPGRFAGRLS